MEIALDLNRRYSYADYLTWIDDKRRELIDGIVKLMSAPIRVHGGVSINIATSLKWFIRKRKGQCRVYSAPFDVRLPKNGEKDDKDIYTVVQPDICVICDRSKLDRLGCIGAPDLIVEIFSPSSVRYDAGEKFALYERSGVREYWLVDPNAPAITVFILQPDGKYDSGTAYELGTDNVPVHIFEGLKLKWDDIFED